MKYLFYLSKQYSISIVAPLVIYLKETGREYAFYTSARVKNAIHEKHPEVKILGTIQEAKEFNPDYVLAPGNFVDFRIPGIKVQLFHGLGVEKPVHYRIRHFFDVFLTSGPYVTERFLEMQKKYKYFDVIETGWIKLDFILNYPQELIDAVKDVPKDKKLILYAPTFSTTMESATELMDTIHNEMQDDEYWFLKFHELMPQEQIAKFRDIDSSKARIITREDISPYLHLSDLMISDTSSVVYEFLALDKPVITYKTIGRTQKAHDITSPNQLRDAIDYCLSYPDELKKRRDVAMGEVNPYLDCKTAERIVNELEKLNPADYPKKHKPLNLIRKMQIIYHSIFRKGYLR